MHAAHFRLDGHVLRSSLSKCAALLTISIFIASCETANSRAVLHFNPHLLHGSLSRCAASLTDSTIIVNYKTACCRDSRRPNRTYSISVSAILLLCSPSVYSLSNAPQQCSRSTSKSAAQLFSLLPASAHLRSLSVVSFAIAL